MQLVYDSKPYICIRIIDTLVTGQFVGTFYLTRVFVKVAIETFHNNRELFDSLYLAIPNFLELRQLIYNELLDSSPCGPNNVTAWSQLFESKANNIYMPRVYVVILDMHLSP